MLTTLVMTLAVQTAPAQGKLAIANDRLTHGYLGAERKNSDYLPGEVVFVAFDILNMSFDDKSKASYTIALEVLDKDGKTRFREVPRNLVARNFLGGNKLPGVAQLQVPLEAKPGEYTLKVVVEDRNTKASASLERKARVVNGDFGLIHVHVSADPDGMVPRSPVGIVGETLHINFAAVGFARDPGSKQPNIEVTMRLLDAAGKPTTTEPLSGKADKGVPPELKIVPLQFAVTLDRVGQYTVELAATDKVSGKTAKVSFPIKVTSLQ
ncbi:MAG TPA: hypothetical protein VKE98_21395 [Gemmataceae bacterium]|nr:hypothetical protein [Gemmataceae bacterium]